VATPYRNLTRDQLVELLILRDDEIGRLRGANRTYKARIRILRRLLATHVPGLPDEDAA
jgi:hypothetical protein